VEVHALSFSATEMELGKVVDASVRRFLGLNGRGHGRHNWVSGGGGLFYLPDSGLRARQLAYTCPRIPPEHRETDGTVATLVTARVNREGRVTQVDFLDSRAAYRESLRDAMVSGWRFQPLVVHGHAMPFRLHFIIAVENGMRGIIGSHCTWDHFNRAHRGSLVPTWIVYVPKHGLPIAYAYIAPQHLGEAPGGLVSVSNEEGGKP
ncbi:MAG: hypothetical protein ACRESR_06155, partial [Gammaproteobacteria bacterium]